MGFVEMEKTLRKTLIKLSKESAFILLTIVSAVLLPQIFHGIGVFLGVGGQLGQIFLPMYLPVLIIGFYRGPVSGVITGFLAPLISFALTDMPQLALLPYITIELCATGALAGAFAKVKLPALLRVLFVQVIAKIVRLAAFAIATYTVSGMVSASSLFAGMLISIPGVVLQLLVLTILLVKKERDNA